MENRICKRENCNNPVIGKKKYCSKECYWSDKKGKESPFKGKKHTEEALNKIREARAKQIFSEESKIKKRNSMKGHKVSIETKEKIRKGNIGKFVSIETKKKQAKVKKGKKRELFTKEHRQKIGKANTGENNGNWNNGSSFEIYPQEFNKEFKQFIKNRDFNVCQTPNCMNTENLCIHHIDYNKKNNSLENFITLCNSCHSKTNFNRNYWKKFYNEILNIYL